MDNNLCTSLITWLKTFPGHEDLTVSKLSDGVALGTILHKIAPEYFTHVWVSKINTDVATNWRLKASNLRKIHQGVVDYFYAYDLTGQTISQIPSPDLNKIVEQEDAIELGKLLQLILGCAINCVQKSKHIEAIMQMEEGMQALLMKAISDLMINQEVVPGSPDYTPVPEPSIPVSPSTLYPQFRILQEQLENVSVLKEDYERRCEELELQLSDSKKKNKELKEEKDKLEEKMENLESGGDMDVQNFRMKDLRKERDALQDELYKVESSRDDYRTRVEAFEKEISEINLRNEELQKSADKAIAYKDEADALRDHIERASILEGTVNTLKKKLEKMDDLKLQNRRLEEMNDDCVQQIVDLQDQVNNARDLRLQVDLYKKQGADLQQKLSDEEKKTQRQSFELNKLKEKLEAVTQEKERVLQDHHLLKDINEDLKCTVSALNSPDPGSKPHFDSDIDILCIPPEIREKFIRLQHENKNLKRKINSSESDPVQQTLYNDLQERYDKLLQENRQMNHQIMVLESDVEEAKNVSVSRPRSESVGKSSSDARRMSELERKLSEKSDKISSLEETILKKENEMAAMEERYKKYLSKAKSVIKTLDPKHNPALVPDVSVLRNQLAEKEKLVENLEKESEKNKMIREVEEKLISTAFYNYGMQMHRQMITQRLSALDNGQSFLGRQRQVSSQRTMRSNFGNSQYYDN